MPADRKIFEFMGAHIEWHDSISSTNDRARAVAEKEGARAHGWIVGADEQTAGRGRKGAKWVSEPGLGLTFSVITAPTWNRERWGWLSLAAALAVCEGGLDGHELEPEIKWPNDVLVGGCKICGILIETVGSCAVVGIGLNVNEREFPEELRAVSMFQLLKVETGRELLMGGIWASLMKLICQDESRIAEQAWERLAWKDCEVEIASGERGSIRGFGENGELNVETADRLIRISDAEGLRLVENGPTEKEGL